MKIIASDYDGTLRRHEGVIDRDREAIIKWRKAGNLFGIVTGRGRMEGELKSVNVEYDFIIDFNGTEIWDNKENLLYRAIGKGENLYNMLPVLLKNEGDWVDIINDNRSYYITYKDMPVEKRDTWVKNEVAKEIPGFMQIYALRRTDKDALETARELNDKFEKDVSALVNGSWLNIAPYGVTKASGIAKYAEIMNVDKKNIFTIGDSYNDMDMIKAFNGFTVLNGSPEVKAIASAVYDGIWELVEHVI